MVTAEEKLNESTKKYAQQHSIRGWLDFLIYDPDGTLVAHRSQHMDSYVIAWIKILLVQLGSSETTTATDTGGTSRTLGVSALAWGCNALINDDTFGIVVGTGSSAVTLTDTRLGGKISHGTGVNQLSYAAVQFDQAVTVDPTTYFRVKRQLTNNTTGSITINEIGIYAKGNSSGHIFLTIRDIVSGGFIVSGSQTVEAFYTIPTTV